MPSWAVPVISTMVPALSFALYNFVTKPSRLEAHNTLLACWSAVFATALATNLIKLGVRRRCCAWPPCICHAPMQQTALVPAGACCG